MQQSMKAFKYKGRKEYGVFYAEEFAKRYKEKLLSLQIEAIIPVPIHKSKRNLRGYNQAEVIATELGERLHIPVITDLLIRTRKTLPQKELDNKARKRNLEQAFEINRTVLNKYNKMGKVLLVDDIYTTGNTIEACTKSLIKEEINEIYFASICIGKGL